MRPAQVLPGLGRAPELLLQEVEVRLEVGVQERVEDLAADDGRDGFEEEWERGVLDLCRVALLVI